MCLELKEEAQTEVILCKPLLRGLTALSTFLYPGMAALGTFLYWRLTALVHFLTKGCQP